MVSVIIPIYNEERILAKNSSFLKELKNYVELIFVDGESTDKSREITSYYGKVVLSEKGRALQMNYGAHFAKGDILFFLHADSIVSRDTLRSIEDTLKGDHFIGGCLTQRIDKAGAKYRLIENFGNIRARLTRVFYGDQGIFVKKALFLNMGGFPRVPIMEDVIFTKRLRGKGRTKVLRDKLLVSPRRWESKGIIKTVLLHSFLNFLYWIKVPLEKISSLYDDLR